MALRIRISAPEIQQITREKLILVRHASADPCVDRGQLLTQHLRFGVVANVDAQHLLIHPLLQAGAIAVAAADLVTLTALGVLILAFTLLIFATSAALFSLFVILLPPAG